MNRIELGQALAKLHAVYEKCLNNEQIEIWWSLFSKIDAERFFDAINKHILSSVSGKFYPKPADIVGHLKNSSESNLVALNAFNYVMSCIKYSVCCDDKIAVHLSNILKLKMFNDKNIDFKRKDFVELYIQFLDKKRSYHLHENQPWAKHNLFEKNGSIYYKSQIARDRAKHLYTLYMKNKGINLDLIENNS